MEPDGKSGPWNLVIRLDEETRKIIAQFMLDNDIKRFQAVGEMALGEFFAKRKVKLPKSTAPRGKQESSGAAVFTNSAS